MAEMFCIGCHRKKYGPTAGICFDCYNLVIQRQKAKNREKLKEKP